MTVPFRLNVFVTVALFPALLSGANVLQLSEQNFDKYLDGERFVFVMFYAPWHGHCKKILERFHEVGDAFSGREDVIVGKVDAYEEVKLATRFWIDDYPIFRYFIKGSTTEET